MSQLDLVGLLQGRVAAAEDELQSRSPTVGGVTLGVVTDVDDPKHQGRVKVRLPWLSPCVESAWARLALPWAGQQRGSYLIPEVDDEVLVAFQHGDVRFPYVVGFMWSEQSPPPQPDPELDARELRSKAGHVLRFDDKPDQGALSLRSAAGHEIRIDDASSQVTITIAGGQLKLRLDGRSGAITLEATTGDLNLNAPKGMVTLSGANVQVLAKGELKLNAEAAVRINC